MQGFRLDMNVGSRANSEYERRSLSARTYVIPRWKSISAEDLSVMDDGLSLGDVRELQAVATQQIESLKYLKKYNLKFLKDHPVSTIGRHARGHKRLENWLISRIPDNIIFKINCQT